jgi:hypothetical protein
MMWLKQEGFTCFDVGGMDPERTTKGIFDFKNRIGGIPYQLTAEIEATNGSLINRLVRWRVERSRALM